MRSTAIAYLLWCLIFVGLGGIHRFYAGKIVTGLIWLFTGGLFLVGQIIDIFLIPGMVDYANLKSRVEAQR
jgi:TM2 domain-containing membrane protein YozV